MTVERINSANEQMICQYPVLSFQHLYKVLAKDLPCVQT